MLPVRTHPLPPRTELLINIRPPPDGSTLNDARDIGAPKRLARRGHAGAAPGRSSDTAAPSRDRRARVTPPPAELYTPAERSRSAGARLRAWRGGTREVARGCRPRNSPRRPRPQPSPRASHGEVLRCGTEARRGQSGRAPLAPRSREGAP